jgi:hypothetical protein
MTIRADCNSCNEVIEMAATAVDLWVCNLAPLSYYAFTCPCRARVEKPADDHTISLLMSGGVRAKLWNVPAEVFEPKRGLPLTGDDLLDFVEALQGDARLAGRLQDAP